MNLDKIAKQGLNAREVLERRSEHGFNELPSSSKRGVFRMAWDVVREPMFLLLVACGLLYLILGDLQEALVLLASVFIVIGIELYQETKTEHALEALKDLSSPRALVIREGNQTRIPGREVVVDDLLVLGEGDRVPADAFVLEHSNLNVDESLLTGESVPVRKAVWDQSSAPAQPGGEDLPTVYSGTLVVSGNALARVYAIGEKSELGKIGRALQSVETEETRLSSETGRLVKTFAIYALLLCLAVMVLFYLTRGDLIQAFLSGLTLAMSVLPEEFPVVLAVFMALGAWRMSKKNVLTRKAPAIETLGSASVLCTDKTGTLTYNRMSVQKLWRAGQLREVDPNLGAAEKELLLQSVLASLKDPFDPMEKAIHSALNENAATLYQDFSEWQFVKEYPLSDELRAMTNVWEKSGTGELRVAAKGSPEAIIALCRLDPAVIDELMQSVAQMADEGLRVLGVASADARIDNLPDRQADFSFSLSGFIGLADPIRETVPAAIKECYRAGIRVIMITGDYVGTAKAIGRNIGLKNLDNVITGEELNAMDDAELARRAKDVSIFARVVPDQKLRIVQALKANDEIVAMTGDGVNDAPALKAANIGISMGQRGTDVAREASSLVLTDDDFDSIVSAVRMGRRIFDNIRKAFVYVLSLHIPIAGMALIPAMLKHYPLVFFPVHIAFLELIIDPACSVVFEMEAEEADIMEHPPRPVSEKLFSRKMLALAALQGISVLAVLLVIYFWGIRLGLAEAKLRALTFTTVVFSNIGLILTNRSWSKSIFGILKTPNRAMTWLVFGVFLLIGLVTQVPALIRIFHFSRLNWQELLFCFGAGLVSVFWFELVKLWGIGKAKKARRAAARAIG